MSRSLSLLFVFSALCSAQTVISIGDSIGAGVQSGDASIVTQGGVYSKLVANQAGTAHPLPLIISNPLGTALSPAGRFRLNPLTPPLNLATSGSEANTALHERPVLPVDSETDLTHPPYTGSQVEIAEAVGADLALCWIGNNDALGAVTSFDQLDASQLTPVAEFEADFREIAQRLAAASPYVIFVNIPSLTSIAFVMDREELAAFAGSDFGLPDGSLTTVITATALRTGLLDAGILENPNFVLDPAEVAIIQQRIDDFNAIIATEAEAVGAVVLDAASIFNSIDENGIELFGVELTTEFLGGLFSLDGIHPSNIGHAIIANQIIQLSNASFGTTIPPIGPVQLWLTLFADPHLDKDKDGRVAGRPLAGLLETLGPALGFSGDSDDFTPDPPFIPSTANGRAFVTQTESLTGTRTPHRSPGERALTAAALALGVRR